jgi:hypothetical protein
MSLGKLIGRGNTAEVFDLNDKEVLKLLPTFITQKKCPFILGYTSLISQNESR